MWPNPKEIADFPTYTEEIFNGKLYFCESLNSGSALVQIRVLVEIWDGEELWQWSRLEIRWRLTSFVGEPFRKNNSSNISLPNRQ